VSETTPEIATTHGPQRRIGHKNKGCAVGCGAFLLLAIAATIGAALTMFAIYNRAVVDNLSETRRPFPPITLSEEQRDAAWARAKTFFEALERRETPPELLLTADELNALLERLFQEDKIELPGRVSFDGDHIRAELSIPLRGLYLNGSGTIDVGFSEGILQVFVTQLELNGKAPPQSLMELTKSHNLATPFVADPELRELLGRMQFVTVTNGKLKITPKSADTNPAGSK